MKYLLDANLLIALNVDVHVHHDRALDWLAGVDAIAASPVVEGSLVRYLVRAGASAADAALVVAELRRLPSYEWWPDDVSYGDLDLAWVTGHRQVTDAYLVGLARRRSAVLATLDEKLARAHPQDVQLVPDRSAG